MEPFRDANKKSFTTSFQEKRNVFRIDCNQPDNHYAEITYSPEDRSFQAIISKRLQSKSLEDWDTEVERFGRFASILDNLSDQALDELTPQEASDLESVPR